MKEVAEDLRKLIDGALVRLRQIGEAEAEGSRGSGKWVKKEVLGHLIDSAANNHQRFVRAQFSDPFVWPGYEQDAWVAVNGYRGRPWLELLELWVALNRHVIQVIAGVSADKLGTACTIGGEPGTLEWWMKDYVRHHRHHLEELLVA